LLSHDRMVNTIAEKPINWLRYLLYVPVIEPLRGERNWRILNSSTNTTGIKRVPRVTYQLAPKNIAQRKPIYVDAGVE